MGSKILRNAAKCSEIVSKIDIKRIIIILLIFLDFIGKRTHKALKIRIVAYLR